ncbi:hypothetical protein VTK26DRAFT_1319 [Humicola hyalothermophila]
MYGDDVLVEEEMFDWYNPDNWYPVKIGDVYESRYQVLLKLGFGSVSTAWLCRDLREHKYVTVKIYETGHRQSLNESKVLEHLAAAVAEHPKHPGRRFIRLALDSFELRGKNGPHVCIVHEPLGLSLADIRLSLGGALPATFVQSMAFAVLVGLDFLHSAAGVVHTDIQPGNFMLSISDPTVLVKAVSNEWSSPGPHKLLGENEIYCSVDLDLPVDGDIPIISDFGDAHFGDPPYFAEVMPDLFRAPEMILGIPWDEKIDTWAFGLMIWVLLEGESLFTERLPSREASAPAHLARMITLLGPPPQDLLENANPEWVARFYNEDGTFKYGEMLTDATLETEEKVLGGESKAQFLEFIRKKCFSGVLKTDRRPRTC